MHGVRNKPPVARLLNWSHPRAARLAAAWQCAEGCGLRLNDSAGRNVGTLASGVTWSGGPTGKALLFNGAGYVDCGVRIGTVINTPPVWLSAWVNPTTFADTRTIFGWQSNGGLQFRIETSGAIRFVKQGIADIGSGTAGIVAPGVWTRVDGSYDAAGNYKFWANGNPAGGGSNLQSLTASNLLLGTNLGSIEFFLGGMTDIRVRRRIPSDAEVLAECTDPYAMFRRSRVERYFVSAGVVATPFDWQMPSNLKRREPVVAVAY